MGSVAVLLIVANLVAVRVVRTGESAGDLSAEISVIRHVDDRRVVTDRSTPIRGTWARRAERPRPAVKAREPRRSKSAKTTEAVAAQQTQVTTVAVTTPEPPVTEGSLPPTQPAAETVSPTPVNTQPAAPVATPPAPRPQPSEPPASFDDSGTTPQTGSPPVGFDDSGPASGTQP